MTFWQEKNDPKRRGNLENLGAGYNQPTVKIGGFPLGFYRVNSHHSYQDYIHPMESTGLVGNWLTAEF